MAGYENTEFVNEVPSAPPPNFQAPLAPGQIPNRPQMPPIQPKPKKQQIDPAMVEHVAKSVNAVGANLRILEERYALMRNRNQVAEEGMVELQRSLNKDFKNLSDEITDLKHSLKEIVDSLRLIDAEMKNLVKKEELKVLDRYLDFWQPMNFVTRDELDRIALDKDNK